MITRRSRPSGAAGPDAGGIVRRIAHEPDIYIAGGRTGFSCIGHAWDIGRNAGGIQADAGRGVQGPMPSA